MQATAEQRQRVLLPRLPQRPAGSPQALVPSRVLPKAVLVGELAETAAGTRRLLEQRTSPSPPG
ncbi:hypothetical protein [Streptomyces sp. NPDC060077]|uniref:hypothetical protein n=1 Tax=Streptomyces sp. NPDC060077 TaxID=3347052 RepID=UPI00365907F4